MNEILTPKEIAEIFINANLEEDYNFTMDDLVKLANCFINAATPAIAKEERTLCIDVVRSLNTHVADKLAEIRGL